MTVDSSSVAITKRHNHTFEISALCPVINPDKQALFDWIFQSTASQSWQVTIRLPTSPMYTPVCRLYVAWFSGQMRHATSPLPENMRAKRPVLDKCASISPAVQAPFL